MPIILAGDTMNDANQTPHPPGADCKAIVVQADIVRAFQAVGVRPGDILLIHSSLKSFGYVVGGALAVIDAAKEAVTEKGTVVFPTLVQKDFAHAYQNWHKDTSPSDVGLISETFRLLADSVRSDQATHSVAAWGRQADELTGEHSAYGPRMGTFGDYCFSWSSPWQKMFLYGARICFVGVDTRSNTFKHFVEYCLVEKLCHSIQDPWQRCRALSEIKRHNVPGVWPYLDSARADEVLRQHGLLTQSTCGGATFTSFKADDFYRVIFPLVEQNPEGWTNQAYVDWFHRYIVRRPTDA